MNQENGEGREPLATLERYISFQRKWKRITMALFTTATVLMIGCSTAATVTAALDYSATASVLAGVATLAATIEKSLQFREKWKHHLTIQTAFQNLRLDLLSDQVDAAMVVKQIKSISQDYAREIPVEARE